MKLYYAPGACSLAAHIALREAGGRFDLERVDLKTKRTSGGRDFLEINPKGYVPALEISEDGDILTEAQVVLQYIADHASASSLLPRPGTIDRYRAQEWLAFISSELHKQFSPLFKPDTAEAQRASQRGKIGERFGFVDAHLSDRAFLLGETFSVADAYLFVMLQWAHKLGIDVALWPNLDAFHARVLHRPAVEAALSAEGLLRAKAA